MISSQELLQFLTMLSFTLLPLAKANDSPVNAWNNPPTINSNVDLTIDGAGRNGTRDVKQMNDEFLKYHNEVRAAVGIPPLTWDDKLAEYARNYATTQAEQHDCEFRHSAKDLKVGECLLFGNDPNWTPRDVVYRWVDEKVDYDAKTNTCKPGKECGHYTQLIWIDTKKVGCSYANCPNGKNFFIGCNYEPIGNYQGQSPFVGFGDQPRPA